MPKAPAESAASPVLHVVVPVYGAEAYVARNVESIRSQRDVEFRCVVIDDCSKDGTHARALEAAAGDSRIEVVRREVRVGQLANRIFGLEHLTSDSLDVIVMVDGDDWLAHDRALARIAQEYADPEVWMTYGSYFSPKPKLRYRLGFGRKNSTRPFSEEVVRTRRFRESQWPGCHPMTFRRFLFDAVERKDLCDEDGALYSAATDLALMYPLFEMAGAAHLRWIPEVLYHRNRGGDHFKNESYRANQHRIAERLKQAASPLYALLDSPPSTTSP